MRFAGSGLNAVLPGRGGDLVKLAFVRRQIDGARYRTLIATAVPETAFESLCAAALIPTAALAQKPPRAGILSRTTVDRWATAVLRPTFSLASWGDT